MNNKVDFSVEFANRLRQERVRLELSQAEMAAAGGVAKATQVGYEQATRKPDVGYLVGAMAAGADPLFLLTGVSKREFAAEDMDWPLLVEILDGVDAWCSDNVVEIDARKRPELLQVLYRHFCAQRRVALGELHRVLKLAS